MRKINIRINSDLGEGKGVEKEIMPFLTSCSIACGGHIGDKTSIAETILIAKNHGVKIGAHPSYPDKENFGRKKMSISQSDLRLSLIKQINSIDKIAKNLNTSIDHIKLHGALYNFSAIDLQTASTVVDLIKSDYPDVFLYATYQSLISELAIENDIKVYYEVFLDRNYKICSGCQRYSITYSYIFPNTNC